MCNVPQNVAGLILAGGQSRRMGGCDKALRRLDGKYLLAHVIERLHPQASPLVLSANGDITRFARFRLATLPDSNGLPAGPLSGVLTGLRWACENTTATWLVTAPVDTPFLPRTLVARLLAGIDSPDQIAVAGSRRQLHPVVALWPVRIAQALADWLSREHNRAVGEWIKTQPSAVVNFDDEDGFDPFFNINTPDDLARAQRDPIRPI
jgi:molybdopterin-guanine dinucleotide biosynthesis protein A